MAVERSPSGSSLIDVLDRVLDKGIVIDAWVRVSLVGIELVTVHTCTLDHPAALPSYLRAGFVALARAFETFPDPRLTGLLPRDIAPQIPLVG